MAVVREIFDNRKVKLEWITKDYQLDAYRKGASNEQLIENLRNSKITWLNKSKMQINKVAF